MQEMRLNRTCGDNQGVARPRFFGAMLRKCYDGMICRQTEHGFARKSAWKEGQRNVGVKQTHRAALPDAARCVENRDTLHRNMPRFGRDFSVKIFSMT